MHTYRPGNLRDEIPKEGGFGPTRAVTPWKKKNIKITKFRKLVLLPSSGDGRGDTYSDWYL
jgi:hypothetical protein